MIDENKNPYALSIVARILIYFHRPIPSSWFFFYNICREECARGLCSHESNRPGWSMLSYTRMYSRAERDISPDSWLADNVSRDTWAISSSPHIDQDLDFPRQLVSLEQKLSAHPQSSFLKVKHLLKTFISQGLTDSCSFLFTSHCIVPLVDLIIWWVERVGVQGLRDVRIRAGSKCSCLRCLP